MLKRLAAFLSRGARTPLQPLAARDSIVYALDSPKAHRIRCGAPNLFAGVVFHIGNRPIDRLVATQDGTPIGDIPVDKSSDVIDRYVPHLSSARRCRFEHELILGASASTLGLEIVYADGGREKLLDYDLAEVRRQERRMETLSAALDRLPMPDGRVVELTQGHQDVAGYRDSILPGILGVRHYLETSGVDFDRIRRCLDFGCGSGRLLVGWWLEDSTRDMQGCDLNDELIDWARANLPAPIGVQRTGLLPPLPYGDGSFDFVSALSVFTHLSLETQKAWVAELRRVLAPGGVLLVTLHGWPYVSILHADQAREFEQAGYLERVSPIEGGNAYTTFHGEAFTRALFEGFEPLGVFPSGSVAGKRVVSQIAAFQDVYVMRSTGSVRPVSAP